MAGEVWHNTYPAWREKVVMTHVLLVYPAQGEKFRVALMLSSIMLYAILYYAILI
jgi:hypothetical protein